jgi:hypothetical protein
VTLTEEQIGALNERVDEFTAADYDERDGILRQCYLKFKSTWPHGVQLDKMSLKTVCATSVTLDFSHTFFLAHSPASLWKDKTLCSRNAKQDGYRKVRTPLLIEHCN